MKVLRAVAGGHFGKLAFGSLDLIFDLSEVGSGDPMCKLILEHWAMFQECVARSQPAADLVATVESGRWAHCSYAMHLMDLGFDASTLNHWTRGDVSI